MQGDWLIWVIGVPVLCLAGFATSYLARRRARALQGRSGWAAAEAALDSARISRDAAAAMKDAVANRAADDLLARAELITADGGGPADARVAEDLAARRPPLARRRSWLIVGGRTCRFGCSPGYAGRRSPSPSPSRRSS